ncbi:MAG: response regulator transcription factor [Actinomycetota bacterium]
MNEDPTQAIRVIFAEDNYLIREGTSALLREVDEVELVAAVPDAQSLYEALDANEVDVVMTDIRMPPTNTTEGIEAARRIRKEHPGIGVLILSQYVEFEYAESLLKEGSTGLGYLLKERVKDVEQLVRAIKEVRDGGVVLDPKVIDELLAARYGRKDDPLAQLTDREREVLEAMAQGMTNASIAKAGFMSDRAVERHINSLFTKLGLSEEKDVHRRVTAVLTYLRSAG